MLLIILILLYYSKIRSAAFRYIFGLTSLNCFLHKVWDNLYKVGISNEYKTWWKTGPKNKNLLRRHVRLCTIPLTYLSRVPKPLTFTINAQPKILNGKQEFEVWREHMPEMWKRKGLGGFFCWSERPANNFQPHMQKLSKKPFIMPRFCFVDEEKQMPVSPPRQISFFCRAVNTEKRSKISKRANCG